MENTGKRVARGIATRLLALLATVALIAFIALAIARPGNIHRIVDEAVIIALLELETELSDEERAELETELSDALRAELDAVLPDVLFTIYPLLAVGALCLLLLLGIFLVNRKKIASAVQATGIVAVIAGLLYIAVGILVDVVSTGWGGPEGELLSALFTPLARVGLPPSIICAALGVLLIVASFVIKGVAAKNADKRAANPL